MGLIHGSVIIEDESYECTSTEIDKVVSRSGGTTFDFMDYFGALCTLRGSSLGTEPAVWFGTYVDRMQLTQAMVRQLLPYLQHFAETGELPVDMPSVPLTTIHSTFEVQVAPEASP